jgi:mono/diheme cytochrome c family protein
VLGRTFLVFSGVFLVLLGVAFYVDASRDYGPIQEKYFASEKKAYPGPQIYQLFPRVKVNDQFKVERCITCHVPDIQTLGPQEAASRLGRNHPAVIDDAVFAKYGQDTLICKPAAAATPPGTPSPSPSGAALASPSPRASASPPPTATPSPGAQATPSPAAQTSPSPAAQPGGTGAAGTTPATCQSPNMVAFALMGADKKPVIDPATGKTVTAQLTGFIPRQYKGLGIDETGCVLCHNGNRQATSIEGAHKNMVPNPFMLYETGAAAPLPGGVPTLYENNCAQCHGAKGEGLTGPPLNDQDRLGFFNDDYYRRCIYLGNKGSEHEGSPMPAWGLQKLLPKPIDRNVDLLVHWIRMWQDYRTLP